MTPAETVIINKYTDTHKKDRIYNIVPLYVWISLKKQLGKDQGYNGIFHYFTEQ